jgi:hypothetical protein
VSTAASGEEVVELRTRRSPILRCSTSLCPAWTGTRSPERFVTIRQPWRAGGSGGLAGRVKRYHDTVKRQADELRRWNAELESRVEAHVKDLRGHWSHRFRHEKIDVRHRWTNVGDILRLEPQAQLRCSRVLTVWALMTTDGSITRRCGAHHRRTDPQISPTVMCLGCAVRFSKSCSPRPVGLRRHAGCSFRRWR